MFFFKDEFMSTKTKTITRLVAVLIIGIIIGAVPGYFYGTSIVPPSSSKITTITATATTTVTASPPTPPQVPIVVSAYGGPVTDFFQKSGVIEQFEKMYNAKVTLDTNTGAAILTKLVAQKDNPQYDVVLFNAAQALQAKDQGLVMQLSSNQIPNLAKIHPKMFFEGVGIGWLSTFIGIGYNTEKISPANAPKSWADLWNPSWNGKIGIAPPPHDFGYALLIIAAQLNGGNITNINPGLQKIKALKPNVAMTSQSVYSIYTALAKGEIWLCPMEFAQYITFIESSTPVGWVMPTEGTFLQPNVFSIVANRPTEKTAMANKFLNYLLDVTVQSLWTGWSFNIPGNTATVISPSLQAKGIDPKVFDQLRTLDVRYVSAHLQNWTNQFNAIWG